jgi:hypothetical protein
VSELQKTVLIHVGAGKTGTTAIQNCLLANSDLLGQNHVWVPNGDYFLKGNLEELSSCGNGVNLFYLLTDYAEHSGFDKRVFLEKIRISLNDDSYRFIVFSCEYLQYVHGNRLASFQEFCASLGAQVKIVYCVRDFAAHAFSSWRQLVIYHGDTTEWRSFQSRYAKDSGLSGFELTLRKFSEVMAPDDIIVLNYSSTSHDIVRRFFNLFNEDYSNYHPAGNENVSDSDLVIDIMIEFNKKRGRKFDPEISRRFHDALIRLHNSHGAPASKVLLSRAEHDRFKASLQSQLDYVNRNFLPHDPIVIAHPDQIGETGRPSERRLAARLAQKMAAELAAEIPALRVFRPTPLNLVRRVGRLISDGRRAWGLR